MARVSAGQVRKVSVWNEVSEKLLAFFLIIGAILGAGLFVGFIFGYWTSRLC